MDDRKNDMYRLLSELSEGLSTEELVFADIASDLAVAIASQRLSLGLTQTELAQLCGKTQATVSKWENAESNFQLKTLVELAEKLNLTLTVSLTPKEEPPAEKSPATSPSNIIPFKGHYMGVASGSQSWTGYSSQEDELKEM